MQCAFNFSLKEKNQNGCKQTAVKSKRLCPKVDNKSSNLFLKGNTTTPGQYGKPKNKQCFILDFVQTTQNQSSELITSSGKYLEERQTPVPVNLLPQQVVSCVEQVHFNCTMINSSVIFSMVITRQIHLVLPGAPSLMFYTTRGCHCILLFFRNIHWFLMFRKVNIDLSYLNHIVNMRI